MGGAEENEQRASIPLSRFRKSARSQTTMQTLFLGLQGDAAALRLRARSAIRRKPESARGVFRHRSAFDRGARPRHIRSSARAGGDQVSVALACAASFLRQLRRTDDDVARRLAARLPAMQGAAFSAHRSGRDHARLRRRALSARPLGALRARHSIRVSRASSSRAKASRKRCGARRWKKPEFAAGACAISRRSHGRFPPR